VRAHARCISVPAEDSSRAEHQLSGRICPLSRLHLSPSFPRLHRDGSCAEAEFSLVFERLDRPPSPWLLRGAGIPAAGDVAAYISPMRLLGAQK
jgi:hypothetical protein